MPSPDDFADALRPALAPLCGLNAHVFGGPQADWDHQFVRLRERLARIDGVPVARWRPPPGAERPHRVPDIAVAAHFHDPNRLLDRLRESLLGGAGRAALVARRAALHGMGGIGKTQLALAYSREYGDCYDGGVWWFSAETDAGLQLDALACCAAARVPVGEGEPPSRALKRWLAMQPGAWLLVYDNAEHAVALAPHLPEGGPHHVVVTSRDPAWGGVASPVELDEWTAGQGADFLAGRLPGAPRGELAALSADLGGLPLALEQAASYVETTGCGVARYRELFASAAALLLDRGAHAGGYERSVAATLSLAFERLRPAAAQLLRLCAWAAPEPLPERFFLEAKDVLPDALRAAAGDPLAWDEAVAELRHYALADREHVAALDRVPGVADDRTEPALRLHRLTQQVARDRLGVSADDAAVFQRVLSAACRNDADLPENWPRLGALEPHVAQLDRLLPDGGSDVRDLAWLLDRVGTWLQYGPALYGAARNRFERALALCRAAFGDEDAATLAHMNNLAETLRAQGDLPGARGLQETVLAVCRRVLGEEHPDTLTLDEQPRRDAVGARRPAGRARAAGNRARRPPPRARRGASRHADLDEQPRFRAAGPRQPADARGLQETVLAVCRRVLGEEHPDTLTSMSNLAETLRAQGDLPRARGLQESVLAVRRRVLGEEHPDTLTSMNNLAGTLRAQGDLPGARGLQETVLAVCRRVLGEEHPDTLTSMNNLAESLVDQGDLPGARGLQETVLAVFCRVLGEEHPSTLTSMNNLAFTLWHCGERAAAVVAMREAASGRTRVLGAGHPDARASLESLAVMLADATGTQPADPPASAAPPPAPSLAAAIRRLFGRWVGGRAP